MSRLITTRARELRLARNANPVLPAERTAQAASLLLSLPLPPRGPLRLSPVAYRSVRAIRRGWHSRDGIQHPVPSSLCSSPPRFSKLNIVNRLAGFNGSSQTIRYTFPFEMKRAGDSLQRFLAGLQKTQRIYQMPLSPKAAEFYGALLRADSLSSAKNKI